MVRWFRRGEFSQGYCTSTPISFEPSISIPATWNSNSPAGIRTIPAGPAGEAAMREETVTHDLRDGRQSRSSAVAFRRLAPTDELRRISPGHGVLVYGHLPPVRLRLRPWYRDRRLRRRGGLDQSRPVGADGTPPPAE